MPIIASRSLVVAASVMFLFGVPGGCATTSAGGSASATDATQLQPQTRQTIPSIATGTEAGVLGDAEAARVRGLAWLVANQNDDGSWGSFESARPSEIYLGTVASHRAFRDATSALATMALMPAAARGDAAALGALERGVAYLLASEPSLRATGDTFYNVWTHTYLLQTTAQ
ncbi:MAG: hypothetical protein ACYTFH_05655, partial [Planctomycetota bacterium]